jgi:hypothetical protein
MAQKYGGALFVVLLDDGQYSPMAKIAHDIGFVSEPG